MMEEYIHQDYPKVVYNPNGNIAVVQSKEEQTALGAGWHDSPADYGVETCPAAPVVIEGGYYGMGYVGPQTVKADPHGQPAQSQTVPAPATGIRQPQPAGVPDEARAEVGRLEDEAARTRRRP